MARKRLRTIDLSCEEGPTITTGDLARVTGLSTRTIQRDIKLGELKATRRNRHAYRRIEWREAKRYALSLGVPISST